MNQWLSMTGLPAPYSVSNLGNYLGKEAVVFFMNEVSQWPEEFTVPQVYAGIMDYCFPLNHRKLVRREFAQATQGTMRIREYVRYLMKLVTHLGVDPGDRLPDKLWNSVNNYLRVRWTAEGIDSETHSMDDLLESGIRFEAAERLLHPTQGDYGKAPNNFR